METAQRARGATLRRALGALAVVALLLAAVVFYRTTPPLATPAPAGRSDGTPTPSTQPGASTGDAAPTAQPTTASSRTAASNRLPPGPGADRAGILLMATPASDGTFDVAEMILLPDPVDTVTLRPPTVRRLGGDLGDAAAEISQLQATAGDQPVSPTDEETITRRTRLSLPAPARRIELRYQLAGVTVRSVPSTAGRALAGLGPLIGDVPEDLPVRIVVTGRAVRNLQCPHLRLSEQSCASGQPPRLEVNRTLPWRTALVIVQLDLPRPQ